MKYRTKKALRGAITILLVIILIPMMTLSAMVVDTSRLHLAKGMVSSAGDLAMNAALANYDSVLKEVYGLFAMSQTEEELRDNIYDYFETTLVSNNIVSEEDAGDYLDQLLGSVYDYLVEDGKAAVNFLTMETDEATFEAGGAEGSQLTQPAVLKKQIVEYMKYRAPVSIGMSFFDSLSAFTKIDEQGQIIEHQVKTEEKTDDIAKLLYDAYQAMLSFDKVIAGEEQAEGAKIEGDDKTFLWYPFRIREEFDSTYRRINAMVLIYLLYNFEGDPVIPHKDYAGIETFYYDGATEDGTSYSLEDAEAKLTELYSTLTGDSDIKTARQAYENPASYFEKDAGYPGAYLTGYYDLEDCAKYYIDFDKFLRDGREDCKYTVLADAYADVDSYINAHRCLISALEEKIAALDPEDENYAADLAAYEEKMGEYEGWYEEILNLHADWIRMYYEDVTEYTAIRKHARREVKDAAEYVYNTISYMKSNLQLAKDYLGKAGGKIGMAIIEIQSYKKSLQNWEEANNAYGAENGDSFNETQAAEIESAHEMYDEDRIMAVAEYIEGRKVVIDGLLGFLNNKYNMAYGTGYLAEIKTWEAARDAAKGSLGETGEPYADYDIADHPFDLSLWQQKELPSFEEDDDGVKWRVENKYYEAGDLYPLRMLTRPACCEYVETMQAMYPTGSDGSISVNKKTELGDNDSDTEDGYDDLKSQINSTKNSATGSGSDISEFGYTYSGKSVTASGDPKNETVPDIDTEDPSKGTGTLMDFVETLLSGLGAALETGRDNVYVMEYVFSNFSCGTSVQDMVAEKQKLQYVSAKKDILDAITLEDGTKKSPESIAGVKFSDNHIYGAEVEYILFGNASADANIKTAKAMLFGIRFAFNCVFAFTDAAIRAQTNAIGAAVQAATLGIVPAPIVAVICQLALAMAESAIDLQQLMLGLDVAVVKTKDTWMLGAGGLKNIAKQTVETAVDTAVDKVSGGLQKIVECGAEEFNQAITDLGNDLETMTNSKVSDIVNGAVNTVTEELEKQLNAMTYLDFAVTSASDAVAGAFDAVEAKIDSLAEKYGSDFASVTAVVQKKLHEVLGDIESQVQAKVSTFGTENLIGQIYTLAQDAKRLMSDKINGCINEIIAAAEEKAQGMVNEVKNKLNENIDNYSEQARNKAVNAANGYIDKLFPDDAVKAGGVAEAGAVTSNKAAGAVIKFGYKDYMRLFFFIDIAVNETNIMKRVGNLIAENIRNAPEGSMMAHSAGEDFDLNKAYSYVKIKADVKVNMLFMNMGIFASYIDSVNEDITIAAGASGDTPAIIDTDGALTLTYNSVAGY